MMYYNRIIRRGIDERTKTRMNDKPIITYDSINVLVLDRMDAVSRQWNVLPIHSVGQAAGNERALQVILCSLKHKLLKTCIHTLPNSGTKKKS